MAAMDFQVVVLAGGNSKELAPLVSNDVPDALLPVANRPVLSFVLELLEASNLKDLIVVVEGKDAALKVGGWISSAYADRLNVEVAAVAEDVGTAGALRAVAHRLTASDIMVVSGDLVSDVPPGAVAAAHRRQDAVVTALLCSPPAIGTSESGSSGGKDKAKKRGSYSELRLRRMSEFEKPYFELQDRAALQEVLDQNPTFHSIKQDVLPYLVKTQLNSELLSNQRAQTEETSNEKLTAQNSRSWLYEHLGIITPGISERPQSGSNDSGGSPKKIHKCSAYIAGKNKYCARLNSIQAFSDINRDIGNQCMLGEGSKLGDKCSVKRSVIGRHCRIGSGVKIVNSVVMDHVTIEDGCLVQGSVVCSNVQLQERASLKDCQVGAGYVVTGGSEHRSELLARK
ncbi:Translation initiation factor eIF-2B subunit gamma [Nymphaea thermarum]|nr:Translation initiation factor eIF-2B subunit gamma [Nymphaea thermarum]